MNRDALKGTVVGGARAGRVCKCPDAEGARSTEKSRGWQRWTGPDHAESRGESLDFSLKVRESSRKGLNRKGHDDLHPKRSFPLKCGEPIRQGQE